VIEEYVEAKILERRCWISRDDLRIFYGVSANITASSPKSFKEIPEDSFVVKVTCARKRDLGGRKSRLLPKW